MTRPGLSVVEYEACQHAADLALIARADSTDLGRRARVTTRDLLSLADTLIAERSARQAIQERAERLQDIVGKAAYHNCVPDDDIPF